MTKLLVALSDRYCYSEFVDSYLEEFWTLREASEKLGVARSTIWRWAQRGRIHFKTVAGRKVIPLDDIRTLYIVDRRTLPPDLHLRTVWSRYGPIPFDWDRALKPEEVDELQDALAKLLGHGGAPVYPPGLAPLIRGEKVPEPIFWRFLLRAIQNVLGPQESWRPTNEEYREAMALFNNEGETSTS